MPQLIAMVLKDHADADHSFAPKGIPNGVATLAESTGVPIGDRRLTISSSETASGRRKITMKLVLPVVQDVVVTGVSKPQVVRTSYVDIAFAFDGTSNTVERQDVLAYAKSLLSNTTLVDSVVEDLETLY